MGQFKIGDRVRQCGREGTVVDITPTQIRVNSDDWDTEARTGWSGWFDRYPVELVTPYTPPPPANTVRVRVAVAVDSEGNTHAVQIHKGENEAKVKQHAAEDLLGYEPGFCRVSVLVGDMPLPEPAAEVEGRVEGVGSEVPINPCPHGRKMLSCCRS
jgi:hypothetical protein